LRLVFARHASWAIFSGGGSFVIQESGAGGAIAEDTSGLPRLRGIGEKRSKNLQALRVQTGSTGRSATFLSASQR
jgi:hypothetical protein